MKRPENCILPLLVWALLLAAGVYAAQYLPQYRLYLAVGGAAVTLLVFLICYLLVRRNDRAEKKRMDAIFAENNTASARVMLDLSIPCVLVDEAGRIVWRNAIFEKLYGEEDIRRILPQFDAAAPLTTLPLNYAGGSYQVMSMRIERASGRPLIFQYWLDRTEAEHYKRLFEEQMPYVALIYVDNYEELSADVQFHRTTVLAEIEGLVSALAREIGGVYRRYESGRFLLVFEALRLQQMERDRFPLLEAAHRIDTGTNAQISLSIAVGVADRMAASDAGARQAMELALGRGGDQAVVKEGSAYRFYGGKRQLESQQSRVKMRLFAKALRQLFENSGDIFIMGHKRADMDCIGAALGVATCAKQIGRRAFIVLDEPNSSIDRVLEMIAASRAYAGVVISVEQAEKLLHANSVLVIVDTQRQSTVIAPELLKTDARVVLIDHHRRATEYIDNATLSHLESRASSASELVTEIIQYFADNMKPPAFVCGALLAGITVDTKHFAFNVGSRTFEAAGYLRRNGADISMVKQLFQDDMEIFGDCADTVRGADVLRGGVAVAAVAEDVTNAKLIAAKAADELIGIRGIEAAFVLGREGDTVHVSGRSLGSVNVQLVCEKMGGGGHLTMAGAQLKDMDLFEAEALVRRCVEEYQQEVDNT